MKIITTQSFGKFIKTNIIIINSFLFASLIVSSLIIGVVPQIPKWVFLITVPSTLFSMIFFYIKSHSYILQKWIFCKTHESKIKYTYNKYIITSIFLLIPILNWIPIIAIVKYEKKRIKNTKIKCEEKHLNIRSMPSGDLENKHSEDEVEQFNNEF